MQQITDQHTHPIQIDPIVHIEHRDRWVWLCIGVFILAVCVAIAVAGIAHAAELAGPGDDGTVDMIKNSGPATGAVLVLFYFLRTWQGDIKTELALIKSKQEAGVATDTQAVIDIRALRTDFETHRNETARRLDKIERG